MTTMLLDTIVLALAWFTCVNAVFTGLAVLLTRIARARQALARPGILIALRLLPAGVSIVFVVAMFLPVHWVAEPRDTAEAFGLAWYALAVTGGALLFQSVYRAVAAARGSRLIMSSISSRADSSDTYEVDVPSGVSLAGILKPRILIGRQVKSQLSRAELDVAIAHEVAHREAFDNLARWAMLCAPDFLSGSDTASTLEHAWHVAAESRADARAAAGDHSRALHLASALIKVARLSVPATDRVVPMWSTLNDSELLEWRVQRLLTGEGCQTPVLPRLGSLVIALAAAAVAAGLIFGAPIHHLTEALVSVLP